MGISKCESEPTSLCSYSLMKHAYILLLPFLSQISTVYLLFYYIIWLQQKVVSRGGVFPEHQPMS
jgi:hypothetical protein